MTDPMKRPVINSLLFISGISLFVTLPPPLAFIAGVVQAFILPGLVLLFFIGDDRRPWTDTVFFTPILSPIMLTVTVIALSRMTDSLDTAIRLAAGLYYIFFALAIVMKKDRYGDTGANIPTNILVLSVGYGITITALFFLNDFLLIRSDAWYHASVVNEIFVRGIPPMEPNLPETPLRYMWMYHLFIASVRNLSGLPVFWALSLLNISGALALPYLCARIIASLTSKKRVLFPATLIAIAGLDSASWILWPSFILRSFTGEVRGLEEISRNLKNISLEGESALHTLSPYGTWMVNLSNKFITITSFGFSLVLFLLCFVLFLSEDYWRNSRIRAVLLFFVVSLGAFLFHIVTGTALICTLIGAGILYYLTGRVSRGDNPPLSTSVLPPAAALAAGLTGLPYFLSLGGGTPSESADLSDLFHIGITNIASIVIPLAILFFPARRALKNLLQWKSRKYAAVFSWIVPLLLLNIFVDLPTKNESKLIHPLFLLLGSIISIEIMKSIADSVDRKKAVLITLVLILFVVPPFLTFRAFLFDEPDNDLVNKEIYHSRQDAMRSGAGLFGWIEDNTDIDAVIMEAGLTHLAPVLASRRNFTTDLKYWRVLGYDETLVRHHIDLNERLFACDSLLDDSAEEIRKKGLNIYICVTRRNMDSCGSFADKFDGYPDLFEKVYSGRDGALYHLKKAP